MQVDLLEGRSYPYASVIATSRPIPATLGCPSFHKRVVVHGLEPAHVESFIRNYFSASSGFTSTGGDSDIVSTSNSKL